MVLRMSMRGVRRLFGVCSARRVVSRGPAAGFGVHRSTHDWETLPPGRNGNTGQPPRLTQLVVQLLTSRLSWPEEAVPDEHWIFKIQRGRDCIFAHGLSQLPQRGRVAGIRLSVGFRFGGSTRSDGVTELV